MKRRLMLLILLVILIASTATPFLFTAQASTGCGAVGGLSGFLAETLSRSISSQAFSAGETISVTVTGASGPPTVQLVVGGSSQTGSGSVSYTIPSDGSYKVTVRNVSTGDYNISVSCGAAQGVSGPPWSGYTDGRLNPEMAENYSLWCLRDNLDIYRAPNGVGEWIVSVPLTKIMALSVGNGIKIATKIGPITIERYSKDVVFVKGNNGTNGPSYTEKFFSLAECIKNNGTIPATPTSAPKPTRTPLPPTATPVPPTSTPQPQPVFETGTDLGNLFTLLIALGPTDPKKDDDGDGIRNSLDLCPDVAAPGLAFGCPDDDGDTLSNPVDMCPNVAGPVAMQGCPDTDGDGISDRYDLCPNFVPPSDKPKVYGCLDSDGDGFPNGFYPGTTQPMDWCPLNDGEPGVMMFMGCPDPDGDGFLSSDFRLVPAGYVDDCPRYPFPWNLADGPCPDPSSLTPTPTPSASNSITALFLYANQVGAYANLYVPTQDEENKVCSAGNYLFCGW